MFNETASTLHDRQPAPAVDEIASQSPQDERLETLRALIAMVMTVQTEHDPSMLQTEDVQGGAIVLMIPDARLLVRFDGHLTLDSEVAYDQLDGLLIPMGLTPIFREDKGVQFVYIVEGRNTPSKTGWTWNVILLVATLLSVLYVGSMLGINELAADPSSLTPFEYGQLLARVNQGEWYYYLYLGIPYALSILTILGAHELGHYFAARRRKHAASLPFFIPFPFNGFGTFGAFIQLREPMRNRKILLEVGAAGPLAGLIFAVPILLFGLATSQVGAITPGGLTEGNSILYALAKFLTFGQFLPTPQSDVLVNSIAWAGWIGLFVTGLNLIPLGQLDGGHVMYSLIGERAKQLYVPVVALIGFLSVLTNGGLLFIFMLLLFFGRIHAVPLDNITPLSAKHRWLAIGTLVVFALTFVPIPLTENAPAISNGGFGAQAWAGVTAVVIVLAQRLRR